MVVYGPYTIVWVTSRSIHCHMALSTMNYLINNKKYPVNAHLKNIGISNIPFEFDKRYNEPLECNCLFVQYILQKPAQDIAYER
jgi:hypothetical protein